MKKKYFKSELYLEPIYAKERTSSIKTKHKMLAN